MLTNFTDLLELAKETKASKLTVAAPYDIKTLRAVKEAETKRLIKAILIGDQAKILATAKEGDLEFDEPEIIDVENKETAAKKAVKLVSDGQADFVMKGLLGSSQILKPVLNKEYGLRTNQLLSYVAVLDVPVLDKLLLMTDPAMNIAPDLEEKVEIIENAVVVANALEFELPKVALVAAVEKVNPKMPATLEAAILAKMGDRGQIKNAVIDGPLAFDNAVSMESKQIKGIKSQVAGQADVIVVPNIEVGNVLYKTSSYLAKAAIGGMVVGASAPVVLSSRADSYQNKLNSIILGKVVAEKLKDN